MAKTCMVEKEKKRKALNKKYAKKRASWMPLLWTKKRPWKTVLQLL